MMNELWQAVLGEMELTISRGSYIAWFKNTELLEHQDGHVVIAVPNIFAKQQMEVKFTNQILEIFHKNGAAVRQITYTIKSASKKHVGDLIKKSAVAEQVAASRTVTPVKAPSRTNGLNPKLVFETFVVGSSNELAYTACQTISKSPGTKYNPLFLYGGVGLGKTHLIQAVGNTIYQNNPQARILYTSTETFVSEFVDSLRFKRPGFSERYRGVDVLIVDDLQFIAGKEKTQEEFFHTFNVLHQADKQIIISSDKPPKSIPTLEDRLRSRLEWGMAIDIQTPDFETRCAILQNKANQNGVTLGRETVEYLATHIQTNIRELEGALNQLLAFCEMRGTSPDMQTASGLLGNVRATRPHHLTIKQVIEKTARHFQVDTVEILSPKRDKHIALPRQVAMYLLRSELHLSFPKIANELGRKDHTTAIHSVEKIEKAIKLDYIIRQQVSEIREKLYV
jgi:chromosomal replication initiator protein